MPLNLPRPARSPEYIGMVRDGLRQVEAGTLTIRQLEADVIGGIFRDYQLMATVGISQDRREPRSWACVVELRHPDGRRAGGSSFSIRFHD